MTLQTVNKYTFDPNNDKILNITQYNPKAQKQNKVKIVQTFI